MAKKGIKKTLEELPIPFRDLKNIVEELRFEDEPTRLRCRGWLVLKSQKFLNANIIFPGSDIDCRLSIRTRSGNIVIQSVFNDSHVCSGASSLPHCNWYTRVRFPRLDRGWRRDPMCKQGREFSSYRLAVCKWRIWASLRVFATKMPLLVAVQVSRSVLFAEIKWKRLSFLFQVVPFGSQIKLETARLDYLPLGV